MKTTSHLAVSTFILFKYVKLMYMYLVSLFKVCGFTFCEDSEKTVRHVQQCPNDFKSWEKAARRMNCESMGHNCSGIVDMKRHHFQYHCVVNAWMNDTVEVCALNRTIIGKLRHII